MIIIGLIAGGLTNVSFIPQAIKTTRIQNTSGISLTTHMLFIIGVSLWIF